MPSGRHADMEERVILLEWTGISCLVGDGGRCRVLDGEGLRERILDRRALFNARREVSVHS